MKSFFYHHLQSGFGAIFVGGILPFVLLCAAMLSVPGCAAVGVPPVDTFNKGLAAGYTAVSAVADGAASAKTSGTITEAEAKSVLASVQIAEQGLDAANQMHTTDPTGANTKLQTTIAALTALQTYLASKGAVK